MTFSAPEMKEPKVELTPQQKASATRARNKALKAASESA